MKKELLEKAKLAEKAEELITLAKENGFDLTEEEAEAYFAKLNPKAGVLADDELDDAAGGERCGTIYDSGRPVITAFNSCEYFEREKTREKIPNGGYCKNCVWSEMRTGALLCLNPVRHNN